MADAAQGKRRIRTGGSARWLLLPVAGAGLYAVARSQAFSRQAKSAVDEVRSRASDLPDELLTRVRQSSRSSGTAASSNGTSRRRTTKRSTKSTRARSTSSS